MAQELETSYQTPRVRSWRRLLVLILMFIILSAGAGVYYFYNLMQPARPGAPVVNVDIAPGSSSAAIAAVLARQGVIKSALGFRVAAYLSGLDRQLKPGHYLISPGLSLSEIIRQLAAGTDDALEFTIPEGYTVRQIAALLQQKGIAREEDFLRAAAGDYPFEFLRDLPPGPERVQGFLFPDTYQVTPEARAEDIVMLMLRQFDQVYREVSREKDPALPYNTRQIVTMASIVEREAQVDAERPLIAGVFYNRLQRGMRLESCATVEYLLPEPKAVLTYQDLAIDSPYNTYRVNGLPPGPIANPGRAALQAALKPAATGYLYFVAKPDGSHHFSRTLAEHNQAAARYQQAGQ